MTFRTEMRVAQAYQIPHSHLLEWDEEDRAKAIAYQIHEANTCQRCGTQDWEWDSEQGGSRFAYQPREAICRGCEVKEFVQQDKSKQNRPGRYVELIPTDAPD